MRLAPLLVSVSLAAQGISPKPNAADYPAHVQMDTVTLGARFLVHSLPNPEAPLAANDYLVVEVAFYGPPLSRLLMSPDHFTLRINGRGTPLLAQLPGMVASSIKSPSSSDRQRITAVEVQREESIERRVLAVSLPEGEKTMPRAGLIYFPYRGKANKIHSVQLLYDGPMGKYTLRLQP